MIPFYKNSGADSWRVGNILECPAGIFYLREEAGGVVTIRRADGQIVAQGLPTEFEDATATPYASLAALRAATTGFFVKPQASGGGAETDPIFMASAAATLSTISGGGGIQITPEYAVTDAGFTSTRYDDLLPSSEWNTPSGGAAPDNTLITIGGVSRYFKTFDGNATQEEMGNTFEILHGVDINSLNSGAILAEIHTHGFGVATGSGDVKIFFDMSYMPVNGVPISIPTQSVILTPVTAQAHRVAGVTFAKPAGVTYNIGDHILVNYRRTPTDAQDTYTNDWAFVQCAMHMPLDGVGSRGRFVK